MIKLYSVGDITSICQTPFWLSISSPAIGTLMRGPPFFHYTVNWAKSYDVGFVFDQVLHFHRTFRVYTITPLVHVFRFIHIFGAFFTPITFWGYVSISKSVSTSQIPLIEKQTVSVCCLFACTRRCAIIVHISTLLDVGFLRYCNLWGGGGRGSVRTLPPGYLSSGALKIPELKFSKQIRS